MLRDVEASEVARIGLVGGLGLHAGIYYYERLAELCEERDEPLDLVLGHADVRRCLAFTRAGKRAELAQYLSGIVQSLARAGADFAAIPAVTPHIVINEIAAASPIPMISILQAVADELRERQIQRVALFGTRFVIESDLYGALPAVDVVRPTDSEIDEIDSIYTTYAVTRQVQANQREALHRLANGLIEREGAQAIVLAATDLSAFYKDEAPEYPAIDVADAHLRAIGAVVSDTV